MDLMVVAVLGNLQVSGLDLLLGNLGVDTHSLMVAV